MNNNNKYLLGSLAVGRNNNLDIIRFIAASLVIISHAFPIINGVGNCDYLDRATNEFISLGGLAVSIFFVFGGFLIAGSAERNPNCFQYFKARCLRIFPSLWVTILLLVFVVGPIFTNLTLGEYFTNATTYKYLLNGVFVLQHPLPGVFSQNIYQGAINGALWTLPIEFICYIGCFIALKLKLLNKKSFIWTLPLILAFYTFFPYFFSPDSIIPALARPVTLFYLGIGAYVYRDKIVLSLPAAFVCLAVLVLSIPLGIIKYTFIVFFPYFIFTLGFRFSNCANFAKRQGEWSYGIYLWGCPIQQMVLVIFPTMSVLTNILVSLPLAIIMGGLLYWLVEKPVARISKSFKKNNC